MLFYYNASAGVNFRRTFSEYLFQICINGFSVFEVRANFLFLLKISSWFQFFFLITNSAVFFCRQSLSFDSSLYLPTKTFLFSNVHNSWESLFACLSSCCILKKAHALKIDYFYSGVNIFVRKKNNKNLFALQRKMIKYRSDDRNITERLNYTRKRTTANTKTCIWSVENDRSIIDAE